MLERAKTEYDLRVAEYRSDKSQKKLSNEIADRLNIPRRTLKQHLGLEKRKRKGTVNQFQNVFTPEAED